MIESATGLMLKRGRAVIQIEGEDASELAQAVLATAAEGSSTREDLRDRFTPPVRPAVDQLLEALISRRFLVSTDPTGSGKTKAEEPLDVFYWHFGKDAAEVSRAFSNTHIAILGVNCVSRQIVKALVEAGADISVVDYPLLGNARLLDNAGKVLDNEWPSALPHPTPYMEWYSEWRNAAGSNENRCLVATSDFGGQHLLRRWNQWCVKEGVQFLPVILQDLIGYVGPLVMPLETACLECLRARENSNMSDPESRRRVEYAAYEGQVVSAFHPSMASVLGDIAAMELLKTYGRLMKSRLIGRLLEINLMIPQIVERRVLKLPRCLVCGPALKRSPVSQDKVPFMPGHEVTNA
jgi:bacteriocin biosynthesis cyclodehydratase domain-containing protein